MKQSSEDKKYATQIKIKRNKSKSKSPSPKKIKNNKKVPSDHKTLLCEITRLKGQQKLLYLKQAKQKNYSDTKIFQHYPFSKMDSFVFAIDQLKDLGEIIKDQNGLHWIQQLRSHQHGGAVQNNQLKMNGWGISIYDDGKIFEGIYHDNRPCGMGYQLQPNGNTYVGSFKEGSKSGKGSFYWFNSGEMYSGDWLGGLPHGEGKYLSNDYFEGQFCNGMKFGYGQQIFQNGDRYVGQYVNGVADGYGEYFWKDGSVYKGDFKHGVRHGYGIWSDKNETEIYSGSYRMDRKQGYGIYEWVGKQTYKGQFRDDYREGYGKFYQTVLDLSSGSGNESGMHEKQIYQGMWMKGKQRSDITIDKDAQKSLNEFIQQNKKKVYKKKRIGHQNCIPKQ